MWNKKNYDWEDFEEDARKGRKEFEDFWNE